MPHLLPVKSLLLFLRLSCLICKMGRQLFTSTKIPSKGVNQLVSLITIFPFWVKHTILWDLNKNPRYTFTKHLPQARLFARCSTPGPMESTHPPEKSSALIVPFFRWGNWGLESCSALHKAMHHISGRSKIWTYVCNPTFLTFYTRGNWGIKRLSEVTYCQTIQWGETFDTNSSVSLWLFPTFFLNI